MSAVVYKSKMVVLAAALVSSATPLLAAHNDTPTISSVRSAPAAFGNAERVSELIGREIRVDGQSVGRLENLVMDLEAGRVLYAIVDTKNQRVGVPPGVFTRGAGGPLELNVDKEKLRNAPRFTSELNSNSELSKASYIYQVHKHFGQSAWWQGSTAPDQGTFHNVQRATDLRSLPVKNVMDAELGQVQNAVVDLPAGRVLFVVLSPNAKMDERGNAFYALPPQAFTRSAKGNALVTDLDKDKLASAPHFMRNEWSKVQDPSFASKVYSHYGKQAYFENGSSLRPTGRSSDDALGTRNEDNATRRDRLNQRQGRLDDRRERLQDRQEELRQERQDILNEQRNRTDVLNDRYGTNAYQRPIPPFNRTREGSSRTRNRYSDRNRTRSRGRASSPRDEQADEASVANPRNK